MTTYVNGVPVAVAPAAHEATHVSGGSDDIDSALADAAIPSLATSKITSTRFPVDRLPALTDEKIWKGTGGNVEEIDVPVGAPSGLIAMWHGTIANIPAGWVICDGNNSTPNLLTRFVEGVATAATDPGATGGEATHTLSEAELASHSHSIIVYTAHSTTGGTTGLQNIVSQDSTFASNTTGSGSAHENEPTFYDVAFLMKT